MVDIMGCFDGSGECGREEGSLGSGSQTTALRRLTEVGEVQVTPAGMGCGLRSAREPSSP